MRQEMSVTKSLASTNKEISKELSDPNIIRALLNTTFKDFNETLMRQAIFEGVIRGFSLKNFLEKDVYAIKYGGGYSLVTSIGFQRKIGARSGIVGKKKPVYEKDEEGKDTCTVTVLKKIGSYIGDFSATVYTEEYNTGKNQWATKKQTMIAKVAESHALRSACPEEMSQIYTEEEFDKVKEETEVYDRSEVADDVEVISTGDDIDPETVRELEDKTNDSKK